MPRFQAGDRVTWLAPWILFDCTYIEVRRVGIVAEVLRGDAIEIVYWHTHQERFAVTRIKENLAEFAEPELEPPAGKGIQLATFTV